MKQPHITCRCCDGTGKHLLEDTYFQTLVALKKLRRATAIELAKFLKWRRNGTAINGRLEELRRLGFVFRTRMGKSFYYMPTGKRVR